ncbi:MAG: polyprenyl synthetase family protein [Acidobacteria bacterium]|jgi:octaprenyl-diphosphate synthase|nr:polyprenyl synthetase family protein [Acidobacteriota bacterium]
MKATVTSLRQARQIREVFGPIIDRLDEVNAFFDREFRGAQPMVRDVVTYVLGSGGKRLRPAFVLLVSKMLGYKGERDVRYAAIVEMIHTATLIHDDIIDGSDLRRGKPTANNTWGNQKTVLVGDWLYTRTMDLCLELGDVEMMRVLTSATLRMTEGEILADQIRGSLDVDEPTYMDITQRKTAELFAAACALPALFQPSTLHLTEQLLEFGRNVGISFQLVDDLLDFTADRAALGKPVMADLLEGHVTLPIILLLERLDQSTRDRFEEVVSSRSFDAISEGELLQMVRMSGVLDEVLRRAKMHSTEAVEKAQAFPPGPERDALIHACRLLLDRGM